MELSDQAIKEFSQIYYRQYRIIVGEDEARKLAKNLIWLMKMIRNNINRNLTDEKRNNCI